MDSKKYNKLDDNNSVSKKSTIYYNNFKDSQDDDIENTLVVPPSIVEDQFIKFQKRNHYLKNTYVLIDSKNRDINDRNISQYINYEKIAILFNLNQPGKLFFTIYNTTIENEDIIMFENINIMNNQLDTLNGININILQYDKILNNPIFTVSSYTNKELMNIFDWSTIYPVIKDIFSDIKQFTSSTDIIFNSISFASGNYTVDDFTYVDSNKSFTIKKISSIIPGYTTSTYYKIPLSYKLFNIYKIKLVDIKLPNIIFNINNTILDNGKFSYGVNAYFKMILKSNKFKVSSIDYVCQSINYNYFNRIALYDNLNSYYGVYQAAFNQDIPKYIGTSIINAIDELLKNCDEISLKSLIDKYGFQVAYYFLYKYTNNDKIYSNYAYAYYVITLDFFQSLDDKLIKRVNVLNNKMPLIYYNNTIIYVNNDTYSIGLYNVSYHDLIKMQTDLSKYIKIELLINNLTPMPIVGYVCNIVLNNTRNVNFLWSYKIAIKPLTENFNALDLVNNKLYAEKYVFEENTFVKVENTIYEYIKFDPETNFYNYKVSFNHNYTYGSWLLGDKLYFKNGTEIATIETISYELLVYTKDAETSYNIDEVINIQLGSEIINFRVLELGNYDNYVKDILILPVILNKYDNPGYINNSSNINNSLIRRTFNEIADLLRYKPILDINQKNIGILYYIGFYPISYNIIFEKSNYFDNMSYLQKKDIIMKVTYKDTIYTYSYLNSQPIKTSKHNLETYNVYPVYDIILPNGYYNEVELSKAIQNELNNIDIKIYDHIKKDFIYPDVNKYSLNITDYSQPVFKNTYNPSNREFTISAFKKTNRKKYKAYFNSINPYLFIQSSCCAIQNNEKIFFDVNEIYDTKLTDFTLKYFNKEMTTRILPTYTYALRLISPIPDDFLNDDNNNPKIYETLDNLLDQIKMNPFEINNSFPNLNTKLKNIGIALINKYNNSNILQTDGTILEKKGVSCLLNKFELCLCITNIHFSMETYKFGRVCKIHNKTSNQQGNFNVTFQMSGDTSQSFPFYIGDIIYSLESKQFFCVVPNEWGMYMDVPQIALIHNSLPTNDIIRGGYINYLCILYQYTYKVYLFQLINDFNLHQYNQINKYKKGYPWRLWFIQEEYNNNYGFEIYFNYNKDIIFDNTQVNLSFLRCEDFSLFFEENKSPKDIMGIDPKKVNKMDDFQNNTKNIPFYHTLSNLNEVNIRNIKEFYLAYGSDSKLKNKLYLKVDNCKGFKKGDTVYFKNLLVEPIFQRNLFNIRETINHSINKFINFEMYLNILIYRLSFIKLGVPIPNAANDISYLDYSNLYNENIYAVDYIANQINILVGTTNTSSFDNFIKINNLNKLLNEISNNDNKLVNSLNITSSEIISTTVKEIRNKLLYGKILPWFLIGENLLNFTHGSQYEYFSILSKYVNISNNIYRLELKISDDLFIFVKNLDIYDEQKIKIGYILDTSLYSDYTAINGLIYHIYISLDKDYHNLNNLVKDIKIYTKIYDSQNNKRHFNVLNYNYEKIDHSNNWLYFYDTYLRFKVIITANPNQNINQNNTLDFNIPSSITSTYNNLFNTDNIEIDIFKNGYYVYIGSNENFEDADLFNDTYRTCITMIDKKNILASCDYLGILPKIEDIRKLNETRIKLIDDNDIDKDSEEYKFKLKQLTIEMTNSMKKYIDIIQLMNDFPVQHTFMINMDWSNEIEAGALNAFKYNIRRMNCIFQILGNYNFIIDKFGYAKVFVYGQEVKKGNLTFNYSNVNLFYSELFKELVPNKDIKLAYDTNTISSICSWDLYQTRYRELTNDNNADFNTQLNLFDYINILYGFVLYGTNIDSQTGLNTKTIWVIFPNDVYYQKLIDNHVNLSNLLITFNFIFIDQNKQWNVDSIEYNQNIDNNIILSAEHEELSKDDNQKYRIYKINLKFTPKYPIKRGLPICIKDYYTTIYKTSTIPYNLDIKKKNIIYLNKNWSNQITLRKDTVIHINMGSNNLLYKKYISKQVDFSNTLNSYQDDNYTNEEINIITDTKEIILDNNKTIVQCTLQNPIRFEFANDIPVILRCANLYQNNAEDINSQNSINVSLLSTIPVLINDEWYTQIYYASSTNMDIFNISKNGVYAFQNNSSKQINISGMKGYVQPNIGFQKEERTYIFNSSTKEEELNNKYIKPVPNGVYNIEYFQKQDGLDFMEDGLYNYNVPGYYKSVYNMNSPEQEDEWVDNYFNNISVRMTCNADLSNSFLYDLTNGINLYDNSNMILLCNLIGVTNTDKIIILTHSFKSLTSTTSAPQIPIPNGTIIWNNEHQSLCDKLFISLKDINNNDIFFENNHKYYIELKSGSIIQSYILSNAISDSICWTFTIENGSGDNFENNIEIVLSQANYEFIFDFELSTNYNNFLFGFVNIVFTDLQNTFLAEIHPDDRFPLYADLTSRFIDYSKVVNFKKYNNNYFMIKGKYLGYGGIISIVNNNDILNQIPYQISHVNSDTNNLELDLEFTTDIYSFYYRNNNFMNFENINNDFINTINYNKKSITTEHTNPVFGNFQESGNIPVQDETDPSFSKSDFTNLITSNYCIFPIKYGILGFNATVFKKNIYKPFSADVLDYIFLCINNIDSNFIVEQQNTINNKIILAKIYINKTLNNIDLQVRHYELVFDVKLLPSIEELEIIYIDKNGNLVNFNNIDSNFTLEVSQYLERVKNINTKNGMVF